VLRTDENLLLLDNVSIDNVSICPQVVAFVKGTRTAPQCGFSHRVLTLLNESRAEYEVFNASWNQNRYAEQAVVC